MDKVTKIVIGSVAGVVVIIGAVLFINHQIKVSDLNDKLASTIGKDQGMMEVILKIPGSEMTYKEIFELCDKSVSDRTQLIVELRGLYPNMRSDLKDSLIDFLSIENDMIRDCKQFSRREMNISSEKEVLSKYLNSSYPSYYTSEINATFKQMSDDAEQEVESATSFTDKYVTLLDKENNLSKQMNKSSLKFMLLFSKYKEDNINQAKTAYEEGQKIIAVKNEDAN